MIIIQTFSLSTIKSQIETEVLQAEEVFEAVIKAIVHLCGNAQHDFVNRAVLNDTMHGALHARNIND